MTVPGETIADGVAPRCDECGRMPKLDVYLSGAGYYIGIVTSGDHCGRAGRVLHRGWDYG